MYFNDLIFIRCGETAVIFEWRKNMTDLKVLPEVFADLLSQECISQSDIVSTGDGFLAVFKSLSDIMKVKDILDFPDSNGERLACDRFFDDWYLYAVLSGENFTYGLFKLREQEFDAQDGLPADGDTPGVTVSFISFRWEILLECLRDPTEENRRKINQEINRVVAFRGQRHHQALKGYFLEPKSEGAYLIASLYVKHIASFAENGALDVPKHYEKIASKRKCAKSSARGNRLPRFIDSLNEKAGRVVCDHKRIYIGDKERPDEFEGAAILATHTGNTSAYSFAAEVEYHARFLIPAADIKIPFLGKSIYQSAIRADMTIDDTEWEGPAPFHSPDSKIVKRQRRLHE